MPPHKKKPPKKVVRESRSRGTTAKTKPKAKRKKAKAKATPPPAPDAQTRKKFLQEAKKKRGASDKKSQPVPSIVGTKKDRVKLSGHSGVDYYYQKAHEAQAKSNLHKDNKDLEWRMSLSDISNVPPYSNFTPFSPENINWERRMACKADPLLDLQTYFPKIFYLDFAEYQRKLVTDVDNRCIEGGKKCYGCPRGGGKTAIARAMIHRATRYGFRKFAFFIGSKEPKAIQTLRWIKGFWYSSPTIRQDFPEIAYPVYRVSGRSSVGGQSQTYKGERTYLTWSAQEIQYPTMLLQEEEVAGPHGKGPQSQREGYLKHDPDCVIYLPDLGIEVDRFVINSAGCVIRVAGIDGSIRGEAEFHPILMTQPRPDLVLLDDVQKDQRANSPKSRDDLERLIESVVDYLSAPDVNQATLMPCTVITEGDVSDTYMTPSKKPEWAGERYGVISEYPLGIDDEVILDEINGKPNEQGRLWNEYKEIRETSYLQTGTLKLANEFYKEHREVMDEGFMVSWDQRFKSDSPNPNKNELSAIQSAMNWRFKDLLSFLSEGQNQPKRLAGGSTILLTPEEVATKTTNIPQNELSTSWRQSVVAFIDVQDEILFYGVLACDHNMTGQVIDYGTYPRVKTRYFRKPQTYGWSLLTRDFFREYPNERPISTKDTKGRPKVRAPFNAKIYLALKQCCSWLLSRRFTYDQTGEEIGLQAIAIDTRWGKTSDVVKRFVREFRDRRIICYNGAPFLPSHKQLEEYRPDDGWLFEQQLHRHIKEPTWVLKPSPTGGRHILADVNRLKTNVFKHLGTPQGSKGCISIFHGSPEQHAMFADHIADSEYPEPINARGITKDCWQVKPDRRDENDYLDIMAGMICLASVCGASLKGEGEGGPQVRKRSIRQAYEAAKQRQQRKRV